MPSVVPSSGGPTCPCCAAALTELRAARLQEACEEYPWRWYQVGERRFWMDGVQIGTASRVATGASSRCYSVGYKWARDEPSRPPLKWDSHEAIVASDEPSKPPLKRDSPEAVAPSSSKRSRPRLRDAVSSSSCIAPPLAYDRRWDGPAFPFRRAGPARCQCSKQEAQGQNAALHPNEVKTESKRGVDMFTRDPLVQADVLYSTPSVALCSGLIVLSQTLMSYLISLGKVHFIPITGGMLVVLFTASSYVLYLNGVLSLQRMWALKAALLCFAVISLA
ncbi:hypothetical protein AK812_SmicGene35575 [Symbiodinium microadriaticum]|uniref:Uncharacterized protein n=1 Tax=Symbiodinium microadriaticum TaxID=2951 RepID=A0A1Q9CL41_SYMMI|nr:hypothetical protein AK812_SmicGene35575 [Symbiodinium microadriaticum]